MLRCNPTVFLAVAAMLVPLAAVAEIPDASDECVGWVAETTPSRDFSRVEEEPGVVRHHRTGLEWQRCPLGMKWSEGSSCTGEPKAVDWQGALQAAAAEQGDDWRLPSLAELRSIVERCRTDPAINTAVFPETDGTVFFWSSSPYAGGTDRWSLAFYGDSDSDGSDPEGSNSESYVRLVRDPVSLDGD